MNELSATDPVAPVLVGRDREQTTLRAALAAALAGRGSLVLISGEAGIGKTALAETLLAEAQERGALVVAGRCYDLSETPPYGPWVELFERVPQGPTLPPRPIFLGGTSGIASQATLFRATRDYLGSLAGEQPVVVLLEDLHWADGASLDLLRVIARDLATVSMLLLVTYRADELARDHPLYTLLPILVREAYAVRLDVRPLSAAAVRALARARYALHQPDEARLVTYLHDRTEGHPLFIGELLRTLEEEGTLRHDGDRWWLGDPTAAPVPPLLQQVIEGRVARLDSSTRELLVVAAVIGQEVPLTLWATVGAVDEDTLLPSAERAIAARLLAEGSDGTSVRFTHALIREALYAQLGALRRPAWHRRAAEVLAATAHPDPDAVAYHFGQAGDTRTFQWLIRAGLRARRADAWLAAIARFLAAATLIDGQADHARERGWLLYYAGLMLRFSDNNQALAYVNEAERLAMLADDRVLRAYTRYQRGPSRCMHGAVRLGLDDIERGVEELDALPSEYRQQGNDTLAMMTIETFLADGPSRPLRWPQREETVPTTTPQRGVLVNWLGHAGRYREALTMGEWFNAEMAKTQATGPAGIALGDAGRLGLGHAYAALGRPLEAQQQYALARENFRVCGDAFMVEYSCWVELLLVTLPYQADNVASRTSLVSEAASAWGRAGGTITTATHASLAELLNALVAGGWAEARRLAQEGLAAPTVNLFQGAISALGFLARHQGEPQLAWQQVRKLHPAGPTTAPGDCYFPHGRALQALAADLALDAGDVALAGDWIAAHGRWLDWSGAVLWQAEHALLRARHARVSGDLVAARQHAEAALARATAPRQPLALLAAHRLLGELATVAARHAEADTHLGAALALADACAAPYERALTLLALAELRAAQGCRADAERLLTQATTLLKPLDALPVLGHAAALAAQLAGHTPLAAVSLARPDGLSLREVEVLGLLAAGRSNGQIAQALSLSPRTVQRHVANIYLKIGAHNKADATAYALRHGLG